MSGEWPVRRECARAEGEVSFLEWKRSKALLPLHFAHANGFNALTYRHLLDPLGEHFHIRASDARGHGTTKLPVDPMRLRNWYPYRDDLIAFLEVFHADTRQPILLAGHSMGATVSLLAAAARPDLVRGVVLIEPVIMPSLVRYLTCIAHALGLAVGPTNGSIEAAQRRRAIFPSHAVMIESYRGRGAFRSWPNNVLVDYVQAGTRERDDGQVELTCTPAWEAASFSAQGHNIRAALRMLKCPLTLIYAGEQSTCRPPGPTQLAAHDLRATILRIGDASHFLPMEYPDDVRHEIFAIDRRTGI